MPSDEMKTAVHEAGHVIGMLIVGSTISEVTIDGRNGRTKCKSKNALSHAWDSTAAAAMCAVDFIGIIAVCRAYSYPTPETDDDFERLGGAGDIKNFKIRAGLLTRLDAAKTATLRARAIEIARLIVDEYGRAIDEVADDLYIRRRLDHAGVVRAVERVPEDAKYLLRKSFAAHCATKDLLPPRAPSMTFKPVRTVASTIVRRTDGYVGGR
jgi:hypothetical protein